MPRWFFLLLILLSGTLTGASLLSAANGNTDDAECEAFGGEEFEVCGEFLEHWDRNVGADTFGDPVSDRTEEIDPVTHEIRDVQYFEYARLEHHPEHEGSPYEVQSGRLGAELMALKGVEWAALSAADPSEPTYVQHTGQAIAPAFQEYWAGHGLDFDDEDVSYRESLARFGYPLTPPEEVETEQGTALVQWFERARLEMDESGEVTVAPLGLEAIDGAEHLSLQAQREIDTLLAQTFYDHDSPALAVWLESPALGEWSWSYGHANGEQPYALNTHQRVGSVTKPVIGTLVLQLVDEGLLDLDDTVDRWFPELDGADEVTIRDLGTMTGGIFNYTEVMAWASEMMSEPERVWEPYELLDFGFKMTETAEAGSEWSYSNTNYIMLGIIIEDVTGNDLSSELQERIFAPLGLEQTSFPAVDDPSMPEPHARAQSTMGFVSSGRDSTAWNPSWAWAAGQIISTPADMLAWAPEMYRTDLLSDEMDAARLDFVDILSPEALEELPGSSDAGYGFGVLYDQGWYGHDGLISGYTTMVAYHPELDASLVIMSNADAFSDEHTLATGTAYSAIQQILAREYGE